MNPTDTQIRGADIPIITAIYGQAVRHGQARFETGAPDDAEIERRRAAIVSHGMP